MKTHGDAGNGKHDKPEDLRLIEKFAGIIGNEVTRLEIEQYCKSLQHAQQSGLFERSAWKVLLAKIAQAISRLCQLMQKEDIAQVELYFSDKHFLDSLNQVLKPESNASLAEQHYRKFIDAGVQAPVHLLQKLRREAKEAINSGLILETDPYLTQLLEVMSKAKYIITHELPAKEKPEEVEESLPAIYPKIEPLNDAEVKEYPTTLPVRVIPVKAKESLFKPIAHIGGKPTFHLPGDLGVFLGELERNKLAITIKGDKGAGKTQFIFQLADGFADLGLSVGIFSLEMGADSVLIEQNRDKYIKPKNQPLIQITADTPQGIQTVREYAGLFDVVLIDSWQKLEESPRHFEHLRTDFPDTIWGIIFQLRDDGKTRGGAMPEYYAGINIEVIKVDDTFTSNYAIASKNRYGDTGIPYNIATRKIFTFPPKL